MKSGAALALSLASVIVFGALARAGDVVTPWTPAGISSPLFESHPAFDPRTGDLMFVRSAKDFSGWRLMLSHCGPSGWTEPAAPSFAAPGLEADPWFTPDGKSLYFISTRASGSMKGRDLDIWKVDRDASGTWGTPVRLPEPVNSNGAEWFPKPGTDGWLYFGSDRAGGIGKTDIWRAKLDEHGKWIVVNLGPNVNTAADEFEALPSPDGKLLMVQAGDSMYQSTRGADGWSPRHAMGPEINVNGSEIGALFSPSGNSMLFARDTKTDLSGEFFVWHRGALEAWPPSCPARAR